jgi:hypothetical protein
MHSFEGHTPVMLRKNYLPQLLYYLTLYVKLMVDKTLLFDGGSIGWLFLVVKGYFYLFCIKKQGPAIRQGKKDGSVTALLRNQITFCSSHASRRHFLAHFRHTSLLMIRMIP